MNDNDIRRRPPCPGAIQADLKKIGFGFSSPEDRTCYESADNGSTLLKSSRFGFRDVDWLGLIRTR